MGVFLAIFMMMTTMSVAVFVIARARRNGSSYNEKSRFVMTLMILSFLLLLCDVLFGGEYVELRLPLDMIVSILPLLAVTCSLADEQSSLLTGRILLIPSALLTLLYIFQGSGLVPLQQASRYVLAAGCTSMLGCIVCILSISLRLRSVNFVMSCGNVWSYTTMTIDMLYFLFLLMDVMFLIMSLCISLSSARVVAGIVSVLLMFQLVALGLRVVQDSLFVIWQRHERRIVESMKMSQTDIAHSSSKTNELYGDIYARLVALFEADKPYLDSELTINDVVKKIFTNKLYISRAISRFTGKNFCQFVNYYRDSYSIKLFRDNPDLKVAELANQSGFNSTVSFSMAFRLYMTECPSDWCRKERNKIVRGKK